MGLFKGLPANSSVSIDLCSGPAIVDGHHTFQRLATSLLYLSVQQFSDTLATPEPDLVDRFS